MPQPIPDDRSTAQPPDDPFLHELMPDNLAGVNDGMRTPQPGKTALTAYDIKAVNQHMTDLEDHELKQIPILPEGTRLKQGATYLDLHADQPQAFTARASMVAGPENWYVPKSDVPYPLWNYLIGVRDPARLDTTQEAIDEQ
jgi:hypothetical protein